MEPVWEGDRNSDSGLGFSLIPSFVYADQVLILGQVEAYVATADKVVMLDPLEAQVADKVEMVEASVVDEA